MFMLKWLSVASMILPFFCLIDFHYPLSMVYPYAAMPCARMKQFLLQEDENEEGDSNDIVYDEQTVNALLDRKGAVSLFF